MIKLRPHQQKMFNEAISILQENNLVFIVGQPRTGKTLVSLFVADELGYKDVLFFTKKNAIGSIESDFEKSGFKYKLTVTNYEQAHKMRSDHDLIIIDEFHIPGGAYPKPSKRAKDICPISESKPIIYLSGTPSPESYSQLFHSLWMSSYSPYKDYKNFYHWANVYVFKQTKFLFGRTLIDYSDADWQRISGEIGHLFVTCTQKEAGFKATINETIQTVPLTSKQKTLIKVLIRDRMYEFKDGTILMADTAIKLQNKIHQICSGTVIAEKPNDETDKVYKILEYTKAKWIKKFSKDKKVAIFTLFQSEKTALVKTLGKNNITFFWEEFESNDDLIFVGQFQSDSEGTKLQSADAIIMYNIMFSSVKYQQAIERSQDYTRKENSKVIWLFSRGGIEEKIYNRVLDKQSYTTNYFKQDYGVKK